MPVEHATHSLTFTEPDAAGIARLSFASGSPSNTMNMPLITEWLHLTRSLAQRDDIRVLLVHGPEGTFSGGADLARIADMDDETWRVFIETEFALFDEVDRLPFVTIGLLDGACLGNAAELALAFDLRIATDRTRFGFPETRIGFQGPAQRVTRFVSIAVAKRLLYEGPVLTADESLGHGLVDWVVAPNALEAKATEVAGIYADLPPIAIRETKRNVTAAYPMPPADGEIRASLTTAATDDAKEGQAAFFARRTPVFRGR